jgi:hypothetical protein
MSNLTATAPQLALRFGRSKNIVAVASVQEASELWALYRDANGFGASESPKVTVIDTATGKTVAEISYNGRVWDTKGNEIRIGNKKTAAEHEAEGWKDYR